MGPADRFELALSLFDLGVEMLRARLRRDSAGVPGTWPRAR
jgi:hypothetical protein